MRRIIPIATTVAVLATTAVSAGQRSKELPAGVETSLSFAPPMMIEVPQEAAPRAQWNEQAESKKKVEATAPTSGEASNEKGAAPQRSTPSNLQPASVTGKRASPAARTPEVVPVAKGDITAPAPALSSSKAAPSSMPAETNVGSASPANPQSVPLQGKLPETPAVPLKNDVATEKKIRDVIAAPTPDAEAIKKAEISVDETKIPVAAPAKPAPIKPHFVGLQGKARPVQMASLRPDDGAMGGRIAIARPFGAWTLQCDMQIARNERICVIQQTMRTGEPDAFAWKLATSAAGKPVIVFDFSDRAEADKGLSISIAGFDKTIPATEWACADGRCSATMPIVGPVSSWFTSTSQIVFRYDRGSETIKTTAAMAGFEEAVQALQNPLGLKTQVAAETTSTSVRKTEKTAQAQ